MNRFGVNPAKPKVLFGLKPEKRSGFKFLLIGETNESKSDFLTLFAGNDNLFEGLYRNLII